MSGAFSESTNPDGKWIRLVSFGRYEHPKGLQLVNRDSAQAMVDHFNSLRGKLMRKFAGLPIYIGHPDDPECGNGGDGSIYGRVEDLKVEGDSLWMLTRWTELGKKLFSGGFLKHLSPRWLMRRVRDRIFQPVRLVSIGMTNHPNLRGEDFLPVGEVQYSKNFVGEAIANATYPRSEEERGKPGDSPRGTILCDSLPVEPSGDLNVSDEASTENDAMPDGERKIYTSEECVTGGVGLHVNSVTENLLERADGRSRGDRILALVREQMVSFGDDYQSAWNAVKRRSPALFMENFNLK